VTTTTIAVEEPVAGGARPWAATASLGLHAPRPGGDAMTELLLEGLALSREDRVVEIWPAAGPVARRIVDLRPRSYRGVVPDEVAARHAGAAVRRRPDLLTLLTRARPHGQYTDFPIGRADATGLDSESATVVLGECLLTPLAEPAKRAAVAEAARLLPPGGRLGVHELSVLPDAGWSPELDGERAGAAGAALAECDMRPLTPAAWRALLEGAGLVVTARRTGPVEAPSPRALLRPAGMRGALRVARASLRNAGAWGAISELAYRVERLRDDLGAIVLIAERPLIGDIRVPRPPERRPA
jgi:hypothetical protein